MAASRTIVATAVSGLADALNDEENGLLVPPADADALALALGRAVTDAALREDLRTAANRTFFAEYTAARMVERYEEVYESVLSRYYLRQTQPPSHGPDGEPANGRSSTRRQSRGRVVH